MPANLPSTPARRPPRWALAAAGAALPWTWFAVRGLGGRLEAVAVGLPLLILVALVVVAALAAVLRAPLLLPVALSLLVFGFVTVVAPRMPRTGPAPSDPITLVSANVFSENHTPRAAVEAILAAGADVEVVVETAPDLRAILEDTDTAHPNGATDDQLVVRSRFPLEAMTDPPGVPAHRILRVTVEAPAGPFVLYAVHALNPMSESTFANQLEWVDDLRAAAARETLPVVVAGDFNMSDRQLGYRRLAGDLRDAVTAAGWGHTTYPDGIWGPLLMRIDHVFEPRDWCAADARTIDVPGSDHDGLVLAIGACP
jgi:endonuclease/exonuclease/phosphatase (EEP) superfamily protein YafD